MLEPHQTLLIDDAAPETSMSSNEREHTADSADRKLVDAAGPQDVELVVNDLETAAVDATTAARVKGGLGTPTPGGPVPIPYPTTTIG
jgi:hypothetical protein